MVALPEISAGAALSLFESLPRHQWEISFIAHEGKVSFEYCRQYKPPLRLSLGRSRRFVCAPDPDITLSSSLLRNRYSLRQRVWDVNVLGDETP